MSNLVLFSYLNYTRQARKSCSYNTNLVDENEKKNFLAQVKLGRTEENTLEYLLLRCRKLKTLEYF